MRIRASKRAPGKTATTAALCGIVLIASAGIASNANATSTRDAAPETAGLVALPQGVPDPTRVADIVVSISKNQKETVKDGKRYLTVTFTIKNKPKQASDRAAVSVEAPSVRLEAAVHGGEGGGVRFREVQDDKVAKNCLIRSDGIGLSCGLGRIGSNETKKVSVEVVLTGTAHGVGANAKNEGDTPSDPNKANNNRGLDWTSKAKPKPKPSSKDPEPPKSDPKPPKPAPKTSSKPPKPPKKTCDDAVIEYSKDNGRTWSRSGQLREFPPKLKVRIAGKVGDTCRYTISYASYDTEGPTWKKSGRLTFLDMDSVTLTGKKPTGELSIAKHLPKCYGQVVLYGNGIKFDGKKYPLPKYTAGAKKPNAPTNLMASWNGGKECAPKQPTGKPSATPSKSASNSPTATASSSPTETTKPTGTATETATGTPTETATGTPTTAPTETPTTTPTQTAAPSTPATDTATPSAPATGPTTDAPAPPPSPATPQANQNAPQTPAEPDEQQSVSETPTAPGSLPKTGASSRLPYLAAMAVFSILLGLLGFWWTSRRREPRGRWTQ